jgi:hypothetical protein
MPEPEADYKQRYEEFWKDLVENPDGTLDKDKVMRELSDYRFLMRQASKVYCHVTGGMASKTNIYAEVIISEHDHACSKDVEEARMEERAEVRERVLAAMRPSGEWVTELERRLVEAIGEIDEEVLNGR